MSSSSIVEDPHPALTPVAGTGWIIDPRPLIDSHRPWLRLVGPAISFLVLVAVTYQLRKLDFAGLARMVPFDPVFWCVFLAYYLAGPLSEWVIFRRLWRLPLDGLGALLRKLVSNEILLGYLGEVYFYAWARRNAHVEKAPFGAIKDVAVLSALVGNLVTLVMVAVTVPLFHTLDIGMEGTAFVASAIFILFSSIGALLLRKRLFTLPRRELWIVGATHLTRILAMLILAAIMWHLLLPTVAITWWLVLATLRQLVSRLPFVPNKDVVFAGIAAVLVGSEPPIVQAITLMATLLLGTHLLVGTALGITELARETQR
ncbi:MAG: hypothetical protein ABIT04_00370 [Novosphingobium sp.]